MKMKRIYLVFACAVLLALAAGCRNEGDEPNPAADKVMLTLNIFARNGDSGSRADALPEKELMHDLRVIIFHPDGSVEHNMHFLYSSGGVSQVSNRTFEVVPNEVKTVYLLANAEKLDGLNLTVEENLRDRIDSYVLSEEDVTDAPYLPMSSVYTYQMDSENKSFDAYVVYAAAKFTFSFENRMDKPVRLSAVHIDQTADYSYLLPKNAGTDWISQLGNSDNVITKYDIPDKASHARYSCVLPEKQVIAVGAGYSLPAVYVPESKNVNEATDEQAYSVSFALGVGATGEDEPLRPFELTAGGVPLTSLFRSTHVKVDVIVHSLEDIEIIHGVYAMINPWVELTPVTGTIVEKND